MSNLSQAKIGDFIVTVRSTNLSFYPSRVFHKVAKIGAQQISCENGSRFMIKDGSKIGDAYVSGHLATQEDYDAQNTYERALKVQIALNTLQQDIAGVRLAGSDLGKLEELVATLTDAVTKFRA